MAQYKVIAGCCYLELYRKAFEPTDVNGNMVILKEEDFVSGEVAMLIRNGFIELLPEVAIEPQPAGDIVEEEPIVTPKKGK